MRKSLEDQTLKCIRCGFCLDACPTFHLTSNEAESPRGRIYLMRSAADKTLPFDESILTHLDSCLGCRACETACPSGVEYGAIIEQFRADLEACGARTSMQRFARKQLLDMLTNPGRMAASLKAAKIFSRLTGGKQAMPNFAAELLTGAAGISVTLPAIPANITVGRLPERSPALGEKRYTVGILAGCAMRVLYHETNEATVRVLQRNGCDVLAPRTAGCCGALHAHAGYLQEAKEKARALLDAMEELPLDAFVSNSAGCGSALKEYGRLLSDDPVYAERAASFAAKVKDITEFLDEIGIAPPQGEYRSTVAYHDACHLAHGQKITAAPRRILQAIPGLTLVNLPESDTCCGSAGIYSFTQPEMARRLLDRKVDCIIQTGAAVVAAGNPGCMAWIQKGLADRCLDIAVKHPVEILDTAYNAESIT